jgi:hypothetical protein
MNADGDQPVRVYADTSVYGGVFDKEFVRPSRLFFDRVDEGRFRLVVSALVEDELGAATKDVRGWFTRYRAAADAVAVTPGALVLRRIWMREYSRRHRAMTRCTWRWRVSDGVT